MARWRIRATRRLADRRGLSMLVLSLILLPIALAVAQAYWDIAQVTTARSDLRAALQAGLAAAATQGVEDHAGQPGIRGTIQNGDGIAISNVTFSGSGQGLRIAIDGSGFGSAPAIPTSASGWTQIYNACEGGWVFSGPVYNYCGYNAGMVLDRGNGTATATTTVTVPSGQTWVLSLQTPPYASDSNWTSTVGTVAVNGGSAAPYTGGAPWGTQNGGTPLIDWQSAPLGPGTYTIQVTATESVNLFGIWERPASPDTAMLPYTGDTASFAFNDWSRGWQGGYDGNAVTMQYQSWSPTRIVQTGQAATWTGTLADGSMAGSPPSMAWDTAAAYTAAVQAIAHDLQATVVSETPTQTAAFAPTSQSPPSANRWDGALQLTGFAAGRGGSVQEAGHTEQPHGPYVAGTLSVPYTVRFWSLPIRLTLGTWRVERVWGLNPQGFVGTEPGGTSPAPASPAIQSVSTDWNNGTVTQITIAGQNLPVLSGCPIPANPPTSGQFCDFPNFEWNEDVQAGTIGVGGAAGNALPWHNDWGIQVVASTPARLTFQVYDGTNTTDSQGGYLWLLPDGQTVQAGTLATLQTPMPVP